MSFSTNNLTVGNSLSMTGTFTYNGSAINLTNPTFNNLTGAFASFTGASIGYLTTNKLLFDSIGSIYFQTGSATGCFVNGLHNSYYDNSLMYYNPTTSEISYMSSLQQVPYLFAYDTTTQGFSATNSFSGFYYNNISIHNGWTGSNFAGSGTIFSLTTDSTGIYNVIVNFQLHSNANQGNSVGSYFELDGSPIAGSSRTRLISTNSAEYDYANSAALTLSPGTHQLRILCASSAIGPTLSPSSIFTFPGNSNNGANITITRMM